MTEEYKITCSFCKKKYKQSTCYEKHLTMCKFMNDLQHKTPDEWVEENHSVPNSKMLFTYIQILNGHVAKLTDEVNKLKIKTSSQNKVKTLTWLNTHKSKLTYTFLDWCKEKKFKKSYFELLHKHDLLFVIQQFIIDLKESNEQTRPICGYKHNNTLLFVFDVINEHQPILKWRKINEEDIKKLKKYIINQLMSCFVEWKNEHENIIKDDVDLKEKELIYITKLSKSNQIIDTKGNIVKKILLETFLEPTENMYELV